jgi:putative hydrolase of the HAD superfamily
MSDSKRFKALFLDIGGVLLTNGWDHTMRQHAAEKFGLDYEELNERHHLTYDTYESGKLSLEDYLQRLVFFRRRPFSIDEFRKFMFDQSKPFPEMLALVKQLKERYSLKVAAISNEGRELTEYRIQEFDLGSYIDFYISSCFVHFRKPDTDIYRIALDIAQVKPEQAIYVEDRAMFVEVAQSLGMHSILHVDAPSTQAAIEKLGLVV